LIQELAPQWLLGLAGDLMLEKASKSAFGGFQGLFCRFKGLGIAKN
jgi:hypothetical protein